MTVAPGTLRPVPSALAEDIHRLHTMPIDPEVIRTALTKGAAEPSQSKKKDKRK